MSAGELKIAAKLKAMDAEEIIETIERARTAGFSRLKRVTVGWKGEVQSMTFTEGMTTFNKPRA